MKTLYAFKKYVKTAIIFAVLTLLFAVFLLPLAPAFADGGSINLTLRVYDAAVPDSSTTYTDTPYAVQLDEYNAGAEQWEYYSGIGHEKIPAPEKSFAGFQFLGWNSATRSFYNPTASLRFTEQPPDTTRFHAIFGEEISLTFNLAGGTIVDGESAITVLSHFQYNSKNTALDGAVILDVPTVTRPGYIFQHWTFQRFGYIVKFNPGAADGADNSTVWFDVGKTLTAVWAAAPEPTVTGINIKTPAAKTAFALGEAFSPDGLSVEKILSDGARADLAADEYTVDSSAYNADAPGQYTITIKLTADETKTAAYDVTVTDAASDITVTWSIDGVTSTTTVAQGEVPAKPANPTKAGHTFAGWGLSASGTAVLDKLPAVYQDTTFYAVFKPVQYNITWIYYDANGIRQNKITKCDYGAVPVPPAAPETVNGSQLLGWDAEIIAATANKTYTATYNHAQYTVTYIAEIAEDKTVTESIYASGVEDISKYAAPEKDGYSFRGWSTKKDDRGAVIGEDYRIKADTTLYAVYTATAWSRFIALAWYWKALIVFAGLAVAGGAGFLILKGIS